MSSKPELEPIPRETAVALCQSIRDRNIGHRFTFSAMQCGGCIKFTKGDPDKMCWANGEGNRGCGLINKEYENQRKEKD